MLTPAAALAGSSQLQAHCQSWRDRAACSPEGGAEPQPCGGATSEDSPFMAHAPQQGGQDQNGWAAAGRESKRRASMEGKTAAAAAAGQKIKPSKLQRVSRESLKMPKPG